MLPFDVSYTLGDGRFTRSIAYPTRYGAGQDRAIEASEISRAITDYVSLVDRMLKACVGGADAQTLSDMYAADLAHRSILL